MNLDQASLQNGKTTFLFLTKQLLISMKTILFIICLQKILKDFIANIIF
jgi:hypothetical protein